MALQVEDRLPAAADAHADGLLDAAQLRILDRVVRDLPTTTARAVEAFAITLAPGATAAQFEGAVRSEAARRDPAHAVAAAARGVTERDVTCARSPLPGCGRLVLDLPLITRDATWNAINGAARTAKRTGARPDGTPEDRTLAQLRADLAAAILTGQTTTTVVPTPAELAHLAEVHVVVAADTLTGASDLPAHLPGTGPIDPDTARHLATRSTLRRLVAHPDTGTLLHRDTTTHPPATLTAPCPDDDTEQQHQGDHDAVLTLATDPRLTAMLTDPVRAAYTDDGTRYRPTPALRAHVTTRDATCLGPACSHPTRGCQLDHTINHLEHDTGGVLGLTLQNNLGTLCDRIHNAKTHEGWHLHQPHPGEFIWTSPTGRTYHRRAKPLLPGWQHRHARRHAAPRERPPPPSSADRAGAEPSKPPCPERPNHRDPERPTQGPVGRR